MSVLRLRFLLPAVLFIAACGSDSTGVVAPPPVDVPTTITLLSGDDQTLVVGDSLTQPVRVRLTDSLGLPVSHWDVAVVWAAGAPFGSVTRLGITDSSGKATIGSMPFPHLGRVEGNISVDFPESLPGLTAVVYENVVAGPPLTMSLVTTGTADRYAGQVADAPVFMVQGRYGYGVASAPVRFRASSTGSVADTLVMTDSLGHATPGTWTHRSSLGLDSLTATSTAGSAVATDSVVSGPPATILITSGNNQQVGAGGVLPGAIQFTVTDAQGRDIPSDAPVVWTDEATGAVVCVQAHAFTLPACSWNVGTQAGQRYLDASVGPATARVAATVFAAPGAMVVVNDPAGDRTFAPGATIAGITVRLSLPDGSPAVGYMVDLVPSSRGMPRDSVVTDGQGNATASWTLSGSTPIGRLSLRFVVRLFPTVQDTVFARVPGQVAFHVLSAGKDFTCGTPSSTDEQTPAVICWGQNAEGQIGDGTTSRRVVPTASIVDWAAITTGTGPLLASGAAHSCATFFGFPGEYGTQTELSCWGANEFGQAGAAASPSAAPHLVLDVGVERAATGGSHTCARGITSHPGVLECWGDNSFGQLGDGTTTSRATRMPVVGPALSAASAGNGFTCATSGALVYCWGLNSSGQLGDGSTTNRALPVQVTGLPAALEGSVAVGDAHACVLDSTGAAYCWGQNDAGQLGDGSTTTRRTATRVATTVKFAALVAGGSHTCGLTALHVAYCWGSNAAGELGLGTASAYESTPQLVAGGLTFYSLAAGASHTCGVSGADGHAYCWGLNSDGQLGDGTLTNRAVPTQVADLGALPQ